MTFDLSDQQESGLLLTSDQQVHIMNVLVSSEGLDGAGVRSAVRALHVGQVQTQVSSLQSVLLHGRSASVLLVLVLQLVSSWLTPVDGRRLQALTDPHHSDVWFKAVKVTGQLGEPVPLKHLHHLHLLGH